jgi:hypothetical protein
MQERYICVASHPAATFGASAFQYLINDLCRVIRPNDSNYLLFSYNIELCEVIK